MTGLMKKYKESLKNTPKPVMPSELPSIKLNLSALIKYAKEKGISPALLTEQEKKMFIS